MIPVLLIITFVVFLVGYIAAPILLFLSVPPEVMGAVVFAVFLFGAIFVLAVIKLTRDTLTFMDMLKDE